MSQRSPTFVFKLKTLTNIGFGYDDSRATYKVVIVLRDHKMRKIETMAHSMGDSCWRKILSDPDFSLVLKGGNGPFVGGCVNWLSLDKLNCHPGLWEEANVTLQQQLIIVSFDMREEAYKFLSLPQGVSHEVPHVESNLGVLRNCLCLFHDHKGTHLVVWQMREYGVQESWTHLLSVSYEHLRCDGFLFHPPWVCLGEDDDILFLMKYEALEAVMYNLKDNSVKCFQLGNKNCWWSGYAYLESLVSPC